MPYYRRQELGLVQLREELYLQNHISLGQASQGLLAAKAMIRNWPHHQGDMGHQEYSD
tara:strand:- start:970 stop:1143 length:174 start_codon:yes stop_codon:yes gene_type:complete